MVATLQLLAFIALQAFIGLAWWRLIRSRAPALSGAESSLCCAIWSIAQVVAISLLLGWLGALRRTPLVLLNALGSAALLLVARRPAGLLAPTASGRLRLPGGEGALRFLNSSLLGLFILVLASAVIHVLLVPPSEWDSLKYHLPMSALMLQTHRLALGPVHNPVIEAYPKDIEIWFHWILSFFGRDDWVDLAQVPFLIIAMLATYCIARRLGSSRGASSAGMLLLPFSPVVLTQITTAYTDIAFSALVLSALALVLLARWDRSWVTASTSGCALGLLIGSKFTGLPLAAILLAALGLVLLRTRGRDCVGPMALILGLAFLFGSESYVRNWRRYGNPVYPYATSVMGVSLPGPWDSTRVHGVAQTRDLGPVSRVLHSWSAVEVVEHSSILGGFGITWPFLGLVIVASAALSIRPFDSARLAVSALVLVLFLATPLNFRVRFVVFVLGLGCASLSHLLDRAAPRVRLGLVAAALFVALFSSIQLGRRETGRLREALSTRGLRRADICAEAEPDYFREAYRRARQNAKAGASIAVFASDDELFPYCLWNSTFSNRVEFAQASTPNELLEVAERRPGTILFLPHRAATYAQYLATNDGRWRQLYANDHVSLLMRISPETKRWRAPGSGRQRRHQRPVAPSGADRRPVAQPK